MEKLQNLAVQAGLCRLRDSQIQWLQLQSNIREEGQVFGIGVKIFTIAGPVILYGIFSSFVTGLIYLFTKQWGWFL